MPPDLQISPAPPPTIQPVRVVMHPLLPVMLTLVVAAIVLSVVLAWLFPAGTDQAAPALRFTAITEEAGLRSPASSSNPENPTTLGGAVAVLDFDGDGAPDLLFVRGSAWPWEETLVKRMSRGSLALWHNDGRGNFTDVTARADLNIELQGMAVAVGDFDNDGRADFYVTCVGPNHLFRNRGDGRFEDVTETAGVGGEENTWSTGATWLDCDNDGRLDLVVAHYARWPQEVGLGLAFKVADVGRSYGAPTGFVSAFPSVYRNLGDGRFTLVADSAGLRDLDPQTDLPVAKPLAIVPVDANGDGKLDLLFSYHTSETALFLNQGDGTFRLWSARRDDRHEGTSAGLATASALSLGSGDERLAAFQAAGTLGRTRPEGAPVFLPAKLGFAPGDFNLDGRFELFSGEGLAEPDTNKFEQGRAFAASPRLLWKSAAGWQPVSVPGAEPNTPAQPLSARGVATADFDGDGDLDVVLAQHDGPPVLLRNDPRLGLPWLRIRLVATRSQPEAGGARVEVHTPRRILAQTVAPTQSYMAQSESTLTFGLGDDARVRKVVILWPSGQRQEIRPEAINRSLVIREP